MHLRTNKVSLEQCRDSSRQRPIPTKISPFSSSLVLNDPQARKRTSVQVNGSNLFLRLPTLPRSRAKAQGTRVSGRPTPKNRPLASSIPIRIHRGFKRRGPNLLSPVGYFVFPPPCAPRSRAGPYSRASYLEASWRREGTPGRGPLGRTHMQR
jgi:hypothetical protein